MQRSGEDKIDGGKEACIDMLTQREPVSARD